MAEMPMLVLWTGSKHSGKTTRALDLVTSARKEGFRIAGLLAPSIYDNCKLTGFYAYDSVHGLKKPLARCNNDLQGKRHFTFLSEGLRVGIKALNEKSIKNADLIVVDEYERFELSGQISRNSVDSMLSYGNNIILPVVRKDLVKDVAKLYSYIAYEPIAADQTDSISKVRSILRYRKV